MEFKRGDGFKRIKIYLPHYVIAGEDFQLFSILNIGVENISSFCNIMALYFHHLKFFRLSIQKFKLWKLCARIERI